MKYNNIMYTILLSAAVVSCQAKSNKCCELKQIQNILENLQNNIFAIINADRCGATPITTAITITAPGNYCFANDITGTITIASPNVSLNLNSFALNGTIVVSGSEVDVFGGTINGTGFSEGIGIPAASTDVHIFNMNINGSDYGIRAHNGGRDFVVSNVTTRNTITYGATFNAVTNVIVKDSTFDTYAGTGIVLQGTNNVVIENCVFVSSAGAIGFLNDVNSTNTILKNCVASGGISAGGGYSIFGGSIILMECQAILNDAGFFINGSATTPSEVSLFDCVASDNTSVGFTITSGGAAGSSFWLEGCLSARNLVGFSMGNTNVTLTVNRCSALANTNCGFDDISDGGGAVVGSYVSNYASTNGTNYCLAGVSNAAAYSAVVYTAATSYWNNVFNP